LAAYLEGNVERSFAELGVYRIAELAARRRPAWCIECRRLMVANLYGVHFCPYEFHTYHDVAKRAGGGADGR
jgi:hypothetical protein